MGDLVGEKSDRTSGVVGLLYPKPTSEKTVEAGSGAVCSPRPALPRPVDPGSPARLIARPAYTINTSQRTGAWGPRSPSSRRRGEGLSVAIMQHKPAEGTRW